MEATEIKELPSYKKLISLRKRVIWGASLGLVVTLMVNLYLLSFGSHIGGKVIGKDGVITVVVAYSICVIFIGAFSAVLYVWWANRYLDPLISEVNRDIAGGA